jgi:hypothetical protein
MVKEKVRTAICEADGILIYERPLKRDQTTTDSLIGAYRML